MSLFQYKKRKLAKLKGEPNSEIHAPTLFEVEDVETGADAIMNRDAQKTITPYDGSFPVPGKAVPTDPDPSLEDEREHKAALAKSRGDEEINPTRDPKVHTPSDDTLVVEKAREDIAADHMIKRGKVASEAKDQLDGDVDRPQNKDLHHTQKPDVVNQQNAAELEKNMPKLTNNSKAQMTTAKNDTKRR